MKWFTALSLCLLLALPGPAAAQISVGGGGGQMSTDTLWDTAGDLAIGTGANTSEVLALGTAGHVLAVGKANSYCVASAKPYSCCTGAAAGTCRGVAYEPAGLVAAKAARRFGYAQIDGVNDATLTSQGMLAIAEFDGVGTGALSNDVNLGVKYVTSAASGDYGGVTTADGAVGTPATTKPRVFFQFISGNNASKTVWMGVTDSTTLGAVEPAATGTTGGIEFGAIGWSSGYDSGNYQCCGGNGTDFACTSMGVSPGASGHLTAEIWFDDTDLTGPICCVTDISGVQTCKSMPTYWWFTSTGRIFVSVKTTTTAAKQITIKKVAVVHE